MTPTPPSTTSSNSGGHSPDAQFRVVRKRNRVPLSCAPCRHRKLKCNRSHPCENCVRRGDASSCSYAAPGTRKKNQSQGATSPDDMQNRIDRLEGLVLSLMTNGAQSAGPAAAAAAISRSQSDSVASASGSASYPNGVDIDVDVDVDGEDDDMIKEEDEGEESDVEGVTNSMGVLKVDAEKGKALYFGDSHWHMVLADIAEVKNYFSNHKKELDKNYEKIKSSKPSTAMDGPAFLFGSIPLATDDEIRAAVPSQQAVHKLVTRYFNSYDCAINILHYPTFHKQLQKHWQDPSKTEMVWLGLLFSILCLAMQSYHRIGDEPLEWRGRTLELAAEYRLGTVQCLKSCDYTKSSLYTIETLIHYVHGEYNIRFDAEVGIWVIAGMIARLGMRMGYHRDPSKFPEITPYQGEMRRRIWAFVRQLDTMFSFQLALPSMIRTSDCDTALPRNIHDDEFGPDSKILPPARPFSEPTPVAYMITKSQITYEFGAILEEVNAVCGKVVSYDDILKRDHRLREMKMNMAPHLRLRPISECTHDPATLLMQRFAIDVFWQKTMCVLHRKYLARARQNPRYAHSRRTCVDSSLEILRHQEALWKESKPGGRMRTMKWFIVSMTKHDFLLAAMIVCLDLHYDAVTEALPSHPPGHDMYFWTPAQRASMLHSLETSEQIWKETSDKSMEAFKAANILGIILAKIKAPKSPAPPKEPTTNEVFAHFDEAKPEHSAALSLGMLSGGLSPNSAAMFNSMAQSPGGTRYPGIDMTMNDQAGSTGMTPNFTMDSTNPFSNLNSSVASPFGVFGNAGTGTEMLDVPANLDWEAWDSYIQNGSTNLDPSFQIYPTNIDGGLISPVVDPRNGVDPSQQSPQQGMFGNSVFMGAGTPGR